MGLARSSEAGMGILGGSNKELRKEKKIEKRRWKGGGCVLKSEKRRDRKKTGSQKRGGRGKERV